MIFSLVTFASQAVSPEMQDSAAFTLERHGDPRGVELLRVRVGHRNIPISHQFAVPAVIAGLNDPRAATVLRFIAANNSLSGLVRLQGTEILARQDNPHVPNLLAAIAWDLFRGVDRAYRGSDDAGENGSKGESDSSSPAPSCRSSDTHGSDQGADRLGRQERHGRAGRVRGGFAGQSTPAGRQLRPSTCSALPKLWTTWMRLRKTRPLGSHTDTRRPR